MDVKSRAYVKLFEPFGPDVMEQVRLHHQANGGMSRFRKFPLYLQWAGEEPSEERVQEFCERFSQIALQGVIDSPWVPGAEEYLRHNPRNQVFVVVSATPQAELEQILRTLDLYDCFAAIYGAPTGKAEAIEITLKKQTIDARDCLMIGDARADLDAARANRVPFLLRRHASNAGVFGDYDGPVVNDMTTLQQYEPA